MILQLLGGIVGVGVAAYLIATSPSEESMHRRFAILIITIGSLIVLVGSLGR